MRCCVPSTSQLVWRRWGACVVNAALPSQKASPGVLTTFHNPHAMQVQRQRGDAEHWPCSGRCTRGTSSVLGHPALKTRHCTVITTFTSSRPAVTPGCA